MKKEVLIIDDDPILRLIVQKMILNIDSSVICHQCENAEIGIGVLESMRNSLNNIIILLDINMPILDGWGFLEQLEKCDDYNIKFFNLYIVSSSTDGSDKLKANRYDVLQKFYHKPLTKMDIVEILNGY